VTQATLARRTVGGPSLLVFAVGASSPLTVLIGAVPTMYGSGVLGVPVAFIVIGAVFLLLAVGYVAMSRYVEHSAPFYAQAARGFNPAVGLGAAAVALLGYNTIQIGLYGLVGTTVEGLFGGPWWLWAGVAWVTVATLGRFRGVENARILGGFLLVELAVIGLFDLAAFAHPAEHQISLSPLQPGHLLVSGISGALAFAMASFTGVESPPAFGEEARDSKVVRWATLGGAAFLCIFYTVAAWAYAVAVGPRQVATAAIDPAQGPFATLSKVYGYGADTLATILLITSVLAAMTAFHAIVARYIFALARERVLPGAWARVTGGALGGAPVGGSLLQSGLAALVVLAFVVTGGSPMTMFLWLTTIGAVCILLLLIISSLAARAFFAAGGGTRESFLVRQVIPSVGAVAGLLVAVFMVTSLSSLLGTPPGSRWPWLVVVLVAVTALSGWVWGRWLKHARPETYEQVGAGRPKDLLVLDHRLGDLDV
jgi:amino acid transporter